MIIRVLTTARRSWAGVAVALALATGGLSGCAAAPPPMVGIALPSDDGRWDDVADVLRDRLADAGYLVDLRIAGDDIPEQVRQVEQLLDAAPVALIVAPVDATSLTSVLDGAPDAVEIVALGTLIRDTPALDRFVAFDAAVGGLLQATALLQGLGLVDDTGAAVQDAPDGPYRIELFAGSGDDARAEPSFAGAMSVLQPHLDARTLVIASGEVSLAEASTLRGNDATAASRLTRILNEAYADLDDQRWPDAVLAPSDAIARGVVGALIAAGAEPGEGFPVVTGRGATLPAVAALLAGRQYATQLEDPRLLAEEAADRVIEALRAGPAGLLAPTPTAGPPGPSVDNGARQVPASMLQPVSVRVADIDGFLIDSGYWTRSQVEEAAAEFEPPAGE